LQSGMARKTKTKTKTKTRNDAVAHHPTEADHVAIGAAATEGERVRAATPEGKAAAGRHLAVEKALADGRAGRAVAAILAVVAVVQAVVQPRDVVDDVADAVVNAAGIAEVTAVVAVDLARAGATEATARVAVDAEESTSAGGDAPPEGRSLTVAEVDERASEAVRVNANVADLIAEAPAASVEMQRRDGVRKSQRPMVPQLAIAHALSRIAVNRRIKMKAHTAAALVPLQRSVGRRKRLRVAEAAAPAVQTQRKDARNWRKRQLTQ